MARIKLQNLKSPYEDDASITTRILHIERPPDITFINLNLMLANNDGTFDQQQYLPLGILNLAGVLDANGYNPELIDYQLFTHARNFNADLFVSRISTIANIVGISCMANLLPFCIICCEKLKQKFPNSKIVIGGVGPSPVAKEIIDAFPFIDMVIEGEGENSLLEVLRGNLTPLPIPKIVDNLDEIPLPAYGLIDFADYDANPSVVTSRGCPYKCTFCTEPYNFGARFRFRSVESVIEEIKMLNRLSGRTNFLFQDDILPINKKRFRKLLDEFRKLDFSIQWKCFSRVDLMDEDLMLEMSSSGCNQIRYGIESGSNDVLEKIKKEFSIEEAYRITELSTHYFESVHTSFIWGYPFETDEDIEKTIYWVNAFEDVGASVLLFEFSPLPGSPIYRDFKGELIFDERSYSYFSLTGHEISRPDGYEIERNDIIDLIQKYPKIFSSFYKYQLSNSNYKRGIIERFNINRRTPIRNEFDL